MICKGGNNLRFNKKSSNENERRVFQNYWVELTRMYGVYTDYYTYDYSLSAHDFFYGEHPLAPFNGPTPITMLAQFNNDSLLLSKFGIRTDSDATFIVPIISFRSAFNSNLAEPKAGDLIRLTELGWDRPGGVNDINTITGETTSCEGLEKNLNNIDSICNSEPSVMNGDCNEDSNYFSAYDDLSAFNNLARGAPIFEITERRDENLSMNYNLLQGHYVWIIHCKRFDYAYQPQAPREPRHDQIGDDTIYGKLSGGLDWIEAPREYQQNLDDESKKIFDYDELPRSNDSVYGNY